MPRVVESLCCKEISALEDKLRSAEDAAKHYSCITQRPRFYWISLDSEALDVAQFALNGKCQSRHFSQTPEIE